MKKKIPYLLFLLLFIGLQSVNSQIRKIGWDEFLVGMGPSNYFGDVGGETEDGMPVLSPLNYTPSLYIGLSYSFHPKWDVRAFVNYTILKGTDKGSKFEELNRDYEFTTNLYGMDLVLISTIISKNKARYNSPYRKKIRKSQYFSKRTGLRRRSLGYKVYLYTGLGYGVSKTTPNSSLETRELKLDNTVLTFPFGAGLKYSVSDKIYLGVEGGWKLTSSDYLDGLKTESSAVPDLFFFSNFYVAYRFNKRRYTVGKPDTGFGIPK